MERFLTSLGNLVYRLEIGDIGFIKIIRIRAWALFYLIAFAMIYLMKNEYGLASSEQSVLIAVFYLDIVYFFALFLLITLAAFCIMYSKKKQHKIRCGLYWAWVEKIKSLEYAAYSFICLSFTIIAMAHMAKTYF